MSSDLTALEEVVGWQAIQHPLPWHVNSDWTEEVIASDGCCIAKCQSEAVALEIIATAERMMQSVG